MADGETITNKYPPTKNINYGNIEATAFVKIDDTKKVTLEDLSIIIKQNNYSHIYLETLVSHISQLEEKVLPREKGKMKIDEVKTALIKPPVSLTKWFNTTTYIKREFPKELTKKFGSLKVN